MFLQTGLLVLSLGAIVHGAPRIVGGQDAPDHKYPSQVSFRTTRGSHFCGGSIINDRWILSAAHCFQYRDVTMFLIVAGTNFLNKKGDVYWPELTVIHESYEVFKNFDVALVRTKTKMVFTNFVASIALPDKNLQDYSKPAVFAGWGSMWNTTGDYPNALQEIELNLVTMERCKVDHGVTDAHVCSLNKSGEGLCYGDSGGGLIVDGELVGIASYVKPCAVDKPDVFTRVWSYATWINDTINIYDNPWN